MEHAHTMSDPRRSVPLRSGERLVVRPASTGDAEGLAALYDGLDTDSRYFRFFGSYRPQRSFLERAVTEEGRGGARLVAVVTGPPNDEQRIVGEAGFTILDNGNGEFAMTVTPAWRTWLAPVLLDALRADAAAHGVPNLEADVMTADHEMIALLRSRGALAGEHAGWTAVRLLVGTTTDPPSWPERRDGLRVVVEDPGSRWHADAEADAHGFMHPGVPV